MTTRHFMAAVKVFQDHPRFAGVKIATYMTGKETEQVSVCELDIGPGVEIPVHLHNREVDSIYVASGVGQAFVNGEWAPIHTGDYLFVPAGVEHGIRNTGAAPLRLFIHHSPPLL